MKGEINSRLRTLLRALWAAWAAAVVIGSLLSPGSIPMRALSALEISDKVMHFGAYAGLAFLPALHERRPTLLWVAFTAILLGVLLEFAQRLSPGRAFEIGDMAADIAGVALGALMGVWLTPVLKRLQARA